MYQEDDIIKAKSVDFDPSSLPVKMDFREMIRVLAKAGYEIRKITSSTGGGSPLFIVLTMLYMRKYLVAASAIFRPKNRGDGLIVIRIRSVLFPRVHRKSSASLAISDSYHK